MEEKYPSFNGMNRPAVVKVIGTPLMPTLILGGISVFSVMIASFYEMTTYALPIPIISFIYLFFFILLIFHIKIFFKKNTCFFIFLDV